MPSFTVRSPTGESYTVNGPEGSTQQDAITYVQSQLAAGVKFDQTKTEEPKAPGVIDTIGEVANAPVKAIKNALTPEKQNTNILSGTTLPETQEPLTPYNTPLAPDEMPVADASQMGPGVAAEKAAAFGLTPDMSTGEKIARTLKSVAYQAPRDLIVGGGLYGARLLSDITGINKEELADISKQYSNENQAISDTFKDEYALNIAKNVGSSIIQNIPGMITGVAYGNAAAYAVMFGQSFLQQYDEGRNKDLGVAASTAYGAIAGTAEVLGERLGFPKLTEAIKSIGKGVPTKELASKAAHYIVNDLAGEELTNAIQFLNDAGFGVTKYKSLEEAAKAYFQSAIDTALVTVGQGAVLGGAGMVSNSVLKQLRDAHSGGSEGYDQSAAQMMQQAGFTFNRPQQEQQQEQQEQVPPPAPPATPPVMTEAGTPITAVPLDTADKQQEAQANAPITPPAQTAPEIAQRVEQIKEEYKIPHEDAVNMALQELKDEGKLPAQETQNGRTQQNNGTVPGANQSSISVPQNGLQSTQGAAPSQPGGLANPIGPTGGAGTGTGNVQAAQPSALNSNKVISLETVAKEKHWGELFKESFDNQLKLLTDLYNKGIATDEDVQKFEDTIKNSTDQMTAVAKGYKVLAPLKAQLKETETQRQETPAANEAPAAETTPAQQAAPVTTEAAPAPQATKGKRGRPAIELTPEEQQKKKETKAAQVKDNKAAVKTATEAATVLENEAPVRENFPTQDAYLDASMRHRTERGQALDTLHEISKGPQRANAAGKKAKEALNHPSITVQERSGLEQRLALKSGQPIGKVSKSQAKTTDTYDPKYEKFTTIKNIVDHIEKTGTPFEKFLIRRLTPFLKDVILVNTKSDSKELALKTQDGTMKESFNGANGMYGSWQHPTTKEIYRYIFLRSAEFGNKGNYQGMNNTVFLHEALHAAINSRIDEYLALKDAGKIVPLQLAKGIESLQKIMINAEQAYMNKRLMGEYIDPTIKDLFNRIGAFDDMKEFVSYGLTEDSMQRFLLETKGEVVPDQPGRFRSLFNNFTNAIREMFGMDRNHQSGLQDLILTTEGLMQYEPSLESQGISAARAKKPKEEKLSQAEQKIKVSNNAHEVGEALFKTLKDAKTFDEVKGPLSTRWAALGPEFINKTLKVLPTADILRWVKGIQLTPNMEEVKSDADLKKVKASLAKSMEQFHGILSKLDETAQNMSTMRSRMREAYNDKSQKVRDFIYKQAGNNQALANAMHFARLNEVTPTEYANAAEAISKDKQLSKLTDQINEAGRSKESKAALEGQKTKRTKAIKEVYKYWDELGKREGGHEIYKMVRQFYRDNLTLTRTLLDANINKLGIEEEDKQKLMSYIRKMQEDSRVNEYFPFLRHGTYWFNMTKGPAGREFLLFDTAAERDAYMEKRAKELNLSEAERRERFSAGNDITALSHNNMHNAATAALKEMFEIIDKSGDVVDKDTLKDQLYQTWLQTTSEKSFRKQFLHADNVAGFSSDILRNFDTTARRYSSQLPKLKFAPDMSSTVQQSRDFLKGMATQDQIKLGEFINEMASRADQEIDPASPSGVATALNQVAYYWLLTGPVSAVTQMASIPIMVYPALMADYGPVQGTKIMAKYATVWNSLGVGRVNAAGEKEWVAPTVAESAIVQKNPAVKKAFELAKEKYNLFSLTNSSILANIHKTAATANQNLASKMGKGTLDIMSSLFNGAERISRESTFAMFFELEYAKSKDMDAAVHKAVNKTQEILGRYDSMNRPTILRNFAGKTLWQFKQYTFNVTSYLVRNGHGMFKHGLLEEEGRAAATRLMGTLLMGGLFHGLVGMPLYSTICAAVDFATKHIGDDDNEEKKRRRREKPVSADNSNLRFRYEYLPQLFGDAKINGVPLSTIVEKGPISALADWNIGSHTSFDGMWFREAKPGKTALETVQNTILANLGPGASTGLNMVGALDDFSSGHIERGIEKLVPAIFKNPLVAYRLATKGSETKNGSSMLKPEDYSKSDILGQALGFQPTKLSRLQEEGFESDKEIISATNERKQILQRLDETLMDPESDDADRKKVINIVRQFNNRFPDPSMKLAIDGEAIDASIDNLIKSRGLTLYGQRMTEANMAYLAKLRRAAAPPEK